MGVTTLPSAPSLTIQPFNNSPINHSAGRLRPARRCPDHHLVPAQPPDAADPEIADHGPRTTDRRPSSAVENVSKKFCRSLKRSLWYGVQDIGVELLGTLK
jgi:hypothetical protein